MLCRVTHFKDPMKSKDSPEKCTCIFYSVFNIRKYTNGVKPVHERLVKNPVSIHC